MPTGGDERGPSSGARTWLPEDPSAEGAATGRSGNPTRGRAAAPERAPADDRFELLTLLGRGGMGEVWRARDLDLGRIVAMKLLRAEVAQRLAGRFMNEARATAALEHPGIVPVHEVGRLADGRPYYTMQEIRGTTLRERIREVHLASGAGAWRTSAEGWTLRRLVEAFHQACEAVAYAHARGVIHRDLKPDNIMLGDFGEVRVVDWGLVKLVGDTTSGLEGVDASPAGLGGGTTQHGQAAGTVGYMPPEQADGHLERLSPAADVYALGGILAFILTGIAPGADGIDQARLGLPRVPAELRDLCRHALQPVIEDRPRDANVLVRRVRAWLDETAERAQREATIDRADAAFTALPPLTRERVREVLLSLVDADGSPTPRPLVELDADAVAILVDVGILTLVEDRVTLAEGGLSEWPRLRAWIVADRDGQRIRRELAVAAAGWSRRGERPGDLWRGELLERAVRWRDQRVPLLAGDEERFLQASVAQAVRRRTWRQLAVAGVALVLVAATLLSTSLYVQAEQARAAESAALEEAEGRAMVAEAARLRMAGRQHGAMVLDAALADLQGAAASVDGDHAARLGGLVERRLAGPRDPAWSSDGAMLATLCADDTLRVYDAAGEELLRAHSVAWAAWEPDGERLAVLDRAGTLSVGPLDALVPVGSYPRHQLAWTREGLSLADDERVIVLDPAGQRRLERARAGRMDARLADDERTETWTDGGLVVRRLSDGRQLRLAGQRGDAIFGYDLDLQRLWVGDLGGTLTIYDGRGGIVARSPGTGPSITVAQASADGSLLAVGGYDTRVRVVELEGGRTLATFEGHDRPIHAVAFHPAGRLVASGGGDDEVLLWEVHSGRIVDRLGGLPPSVRAIAFSPDGQRLAISAGDRLVTWSPAALPDEAVARCGGTRVELSPDRSLLASADRDGLCLTRLDDGALVRVPGVRSAEPLAEGVAVGLSGDSVVRVSARGEVAPAGAELVDARAVLVGPRDELAWIDAEGVLHGGHDEATWALVLEDWPGWHHHVPGQRYLSYLDLGGRVVVVDLVRGEQVLVVPADQVSPLNLGWTIDAYRLLTGDLHGQVRSWDLRNPTAGGTVVDAGLDDAVSALALAGTTLAVGDATGRVRVVDERVPLLDRVLDAGMLPTALHLSPDQHHLLVGLDHAAFQVIELATGRTMLAVDRGARGLLHTIAWTDDGRVLGVGTDDAWLWSAPDAAPDPLLRTNLRVCRRSLAVVPVARAATDSPWAPDAACRDHGAG